MNEENSKAMDCDSDTSERGPGSGTDRASTGGSGGERARHRVILQREANRVRQARCAVAAAILVCAMAVGVSVYGEFNSFNLEYEIHVADVIKLVQWEVQYNFALMQQLSASVTATAAMTGSVFPNLTQPYFEISGGYVDGLGGIMSAMFAPLITSEEREQWEEYSGQNLWWLSQGEKLREDHPGHRAPMTGTHQDHEHDRRLQADVTHSKVQVSKAIFRWKNGTKVPEHMKADQVYAPLWQVSPPDPTSVNANLLSEKILKDMFAAVVETNYSVLSPATEIGNLFDFLFDDDEKHQMQQPHSFIMEPVYSTFSESRELVGVLVALTKFENLLDKLLPNNAIGMTCVVADTCGNIMTYTIEGQEATFLGYGDLHDRRFDGRMRSTPVELYNTRVDGLCAHELFIYPSKSLLGSYKESKPSIYTIVVAVAFFVTSILLLVYDRIVSRQQESTLQSALRTGALVDSLFPANVRDRVMDSAAVEAEAAKLGQEGQGLFKSRPIADFFASTTLMFGDIAGFTAWSSQREPFQVFELLETLYGAFDVVAKKRDVFKVETIGDCYVAVCGIPKPKDDHAIIMARFARDCLYKMNELTRQLDVRLGPDTSALLIRIGLHSGPLTGGVLRGENARFQLFGDTVNTAARMESTGVPNQIQMSQVTADLLIGAGKAAWVTPRNEVVHAKGKGAMKTYWLSVKENSGGAPSIGHSSQDDKSERIGIKLSSDDKFGIGEKTVRLVDWHVEVLLRLLKLTVETRRTAVEDVGWTSCSSNKNVIDEVAEIIELPEPVNGKGKGGLISQQVKNQLREYVLNIANLYPANSFHNFEHATHVTMSVSKLLGRIVAPPTLDSAATNQHDHTYGITSDALTQFACLFSALIHDVDHAGVPNTQLVLEQAPVAVKYQGKSVAEQNSVDVAWNLLLEPQFEDLRRALCATDAEVKRFRQLLINAVMATDIMAKDLKAARDAKWARAFDHAVVAHESPQTVTHRKATIVIDHLMQASDVAHTMQHWHVYRKWNERLFVEMSTAFAQGRADRNPADGWYEGELGFFDHYIIPLAKKLEQCGVFGFASDEYLNYATKNREEWHVKGQDIVRDMVQRFQASVDNTSPTAHPHERTNLYFL